MKFGERGTLLWKKDFLRFRDRKLKPVQSGQLPSDEIITAPLKPSCGYNLYVFSGRKLIPHSHVGTGLIMKTHRVGHDLEHSL